MLSELSEPRSTCVDNFLSGAYCGARFCSDFAFYLGRLQGAKTLLHRLASIVPCAMVDIQQISLAHN